MQLTEKQMSEALVVTMTGRLDAGSASQVQEQLQTRCQGHSGLMVLSFEGVDYISSVGLRALIMAAKSAKAAGVTLVLSDMKDHIREVFEIAGFSQVMTMYDTTEQALDAGD